MKNITRKISGVLLVLVLVLNMTSCSSLLGAFIGSGDGSEGGFGESGGVDFPGSDESTRPGEWGGVSDFSDTIHIRIMRGESVNLASYIDGLSSLPSLTWSSRCENIATVDGGVATGVAAGKTVISASISNTVFASFSVTVEFEVSKNNGFSIVTDLTDGKTYSASSLYEANRILDRAIADRKSKVKIDFSALSRDFNMKTDFDLDSELGTHTSIKMLQTPGNPTVTFEIVYHTDAASVVLPLTEKYTYYSLTNANGVIRRVLEREAGAVRSDDFDGFKINTDNLGEIEVYNSEELWWAVEHGYKPVFPIETKAALFYERAKMILREIITDTMSDYEKALAIYEYLVEAVSYDYDAYYSDTDKENVCYYLEGVFEYGRAVCDGKAKAFVLLCGIEGIECVRAFGETLDGGVGHAWNYVCIDGRWYLVDTTEGDVRYEGKEIESFIGDKVQIVGYDGIFKPCTYYKDEYVYSDMWADIYVMPFYEIDYFASSLGDTKYDFTLNSRTELEAMMAALYKDGEPESFVLTFIGDDKGEFWSYFSTVENKYGFTKRVFTVNYDFGKVHLVFCVAK